MALIIVNDKNVTWIKKTSFISYVKSSTYNLNSVFPAD